MEAKKLFISKDESKKLKHSLVYAFKLYVHSCNIVEVVLVFIVV